jgi:O-antigen/teichoic acid export membrane protein
MLKQPGTLALADQCVLSGTNFLTLLFVSRHVSANEFGLFSLAALGLLFLSNLHRAIVTQPLNLLGAGESAEDLKSRISTLLRAHAVIIPVSIAMLGTLSLRYFPDLHLLVAASCYLGCFLLQETLRRYWYTIGRVDRALVNDLISYGGQLIALVSISFFSAIDGTTTLLVMAATSLLAFLAGLQEVDRSGRTTLARMREVASQHGTMSGWLVLTVLALWGATQLYPFLIAPLGPAAVAAFVASRNPLNAIGVAVQSVGNYLPTSATTLLREHGHVEFRRHMIRTMLMAFAACIVFVLLMQVLARPILDFMYEGRYSDGAPLLRMLSVGIVFALLGTVLGSYALALRDARSNFLSNLGATVFTFTGGLWLIHAHGLIGAAIGGCLSVAIATVLQGGFVWRQINRIAHGDHGGRKAAMVEIGPIIAPLSNPSTDPIRPGVDA